MKKIIVQIDNETHTQLVKIAEKEYRSLCSHCSWIIKNYVENFSQEKSNKPMKIPVKNSPFFD